MAIIGAVGDARRNRAGGRRGGALWVGEVTLDGSNPTPVTTSLKTVLFAVAVLKKSTADATGAANVQSVSVDYGGGVTAGVVNIYGWGATATADTAQIASTNAARVVSVFAYGLE